MRKSVDTDHQCFLDLTGYKHLGGVSRRRPNSLGPRWDLRTHVTTTPLHSRRRQHRGHGSVSFTSSSEVLNHSCAWPLDLGLTEAVGTSQNAMGWRQAGGSSFTLSHRAGASVGRPVVQARDPSPASPWGLQQGDLGRSTRPPIGLDGDLPATLGSRRGEFLVTPVTFIPGEGENHTSSHICLPTPKRAISSVFWAVPTAMAIGC